MQDFVHKQRDCEAFSLANLFAVRNNPPEERKWNKTLNKIKRAYCELNLCEGTEILIDRRTRTVHRVVNDTVSDIAKVSTDANITWIEDVVDQLKENVRELLNEEE